MDDGNSERDESSSAYRSADLDEDSSRYFSAADDDNESSADGHGLVIDEGRDEEEAVVKPTDNYNFPEGSHCVTIQIDGSRVDAINIGQDIYIYTDADGDLRAFQILQDQETAIKYLHVGKKEDGSIEVYEEQVNQVPVTPQETEKIEKPVDSLLSTNDSDDDFCIDGEPVTGDCCDPNDKDDVDPPPKSSAENGNGAAPSPILTKPPSTLGKSTSPSPSKTTPAERPQIDTGATLNASASPSQAAIRDSIQSSKAQDPSDGRRLPPSPSPVKIQPHSPSPKSKAQDQSDGRRLPPPPSPVKIQPHSPSPKSKAQDTSDGRRLPPPPSPVKIQPRSPSPKSKAQDASDGRRLPPPPSPVKIQPRSPSPKSRRPPPPGIREKSRNPDSDDESFSINLKTYAVKTYSKDPIKGEGSPAKIDGDLKKMDGVKSGSPNKMKSVTTTDSTKDASPEKLNIIKTEVNKGDSLKKIDSVKEGSPRKFNNVISINADKADSPKKINNSGTVDVAKMDSPKKINNSGTIGVAKTDSPKKINNSGTIDVGKTGSPKKIHSETVYVDKAASPKKTINVDKSGSPKKINNITIADFNNKCFSPKRLNDTTKPHIDGSPVRKNENPPSANKSRHPRKQVFSPTPVAEIEMIFPGRNDDDDDRLCQESSRIAQKPPKKKEQAPKKTDRFNGSEKIVDEIEINSKQVINENNTIVNEKKIIHSENGQFAAVLEVAEIKNDKKNEPVENNPAHEGNEDIKDCHTVNSPKETSSQPSTPGSKRKKGRPKKFTLTDDDFMPNMTKASPAANNNSLDIEAENVCSLCLKNFRTQMVLLKHARHCNGGVTPEAKPKKPDKIETPKVNKIAKSDDTITSIAPKEIPLNPEKDLKIISTLISSEKDLTSESDLITVNSEIDSKSLEKDLVSKSDIKSMNVEKNLNGVEQDSKGKLDPKPSIGKNKRILTIKKSNIPSPMSRLTKILKTKPPPSVQIKAIECEICKKTFRQYAHMVFHRKQHQDPPKPVQEASKEEIKKKDDGQESQATILSCEICKKGFRKLHHLVQHRESHVEMKPPSRRASSVRSEPPAESAAFRCEPCDKSFRKLHHLVQHREQHEPVLDRKRQSEIRQEGPDSKIRKTDNNVRLSFTSCSTTASSTEEGHGCGVCGKSYRKLHHLVEHRESHNEAARPTSHDKLNAKDIIHECARCYMVFPNVNALNKHTHNCLSKKKLVKRLPPPSDITDESDLPPPSSLPQPAAPKTTQSRLPLKSDSNKGKISLKTKIPSVAKKTKLTDDHVNVKAKKSKLDDDDVNIKYKFPEAARPKATLVVASKSKRLHTPTRRGKTMSIKPKVAVAAKPSKVVLKKSIDDDDDNDEDDDVIRYSFPKTPKSNQSVVDLTTPESSVKAKRRTASPQKTSDPKESRKIGIDQRPIAKRKTDSLPKRSTVATSSKKGEDGNKCDCGKAFDSGMLLRRHIESEHTPPKSFRCPHCPAGASFRTAVQFARHKSESHSDIAVGVNKARKVLQVDTKKSRPAHGGVPLSKKMMRAIANANF